MLSASRALEWLHDNPVAGVLTEMDFDHGPTGQDLIEHLRGSGRDVQIIATSVRNRRTVGAERLGKLDVLFIPKPYNVRFVVGMVGGMLRYGARRVPTLALRRLAPGEVLVRQGDRGSEAFIVRGGRLAITCEGPHGTHEIGTAGPGEMVGEMAFLNETVRAATLTAMESTELAVLDLEAFRDYLEGQPAWLRVMLQSLTRRLRERSETLATVQRRALSQAGRRESVAAESTVEPPLGDLKRKQATMWGRGEYERIAETLAVMHDELIRRLDPRPGEKWLDLATGTGEVAFRAARMGARVSGVDLAPALIARARKIARTKSLDIRFELGDAEHLVHPDASFDVVASAVGIIFATDHVAAAREVARVCRPGGRIGITAWRLDGGVGDFFRVIEPFQTDRQRAGNSAFEWASDGYASSLLGAAFELEMFEFDAPFVAVSSDAAWEKLSTSYGPLIALAEALNSARREELRQAVIAFYDRFWNGSEVRHSRRYVMLVGKRR
jgi:CRP-like cAMP-binding protein